MKINNVVQYLDTVFDPKSFVDSSLNGLQVEPTDLRNSLKVKKIAFAVDAGLSVIEQAIECKADLLIVHHGIFWGKQSAIVGPLSDKISALVRANLALYAMHLPLDAHPILGNNVQLADFYGISQLEPFCLLDGNFIGMHGSASIPGQNTLEYFTQRSKEMLGYSNVLALPFGGQKIEKVGILSGSGTFAISEASTLGLDLFITGEPKQEAYHMAKELCINVLFAGHYATETFGLLALKSQIEKELGLETIFIDEPTGI